MKQLPETVTMTKEQFEQMLCLGEAFSATEALKSILGWSHDEAVEFIMEFWGVNEVLREMSEGRC